jgi:hypothetical protein
MGVAARLAALSLVAVALAPPAQAEALKCAPVSESEARRISDVVFEGVVGGHLGAGAEAEATPGKPPRVLLEFRDFRFRVARYLRGDGDDNVAVMRVLIAGAFPRSDPRPGEAWRVYARRDTSGRLRFSVCVPYTSRLRGAEERRVRELLSGGSEEGPGDGPSDGGDDNDDGFPLLLAAALALVAAGTLGIALLARRR